MGMDCWCNKVWPCSEISLWQWLLCYSQSMKYHIYVHSVCKQRTNGSIKIIYVLNITFQIWKSWTIHCKCRIKFVTKWQHFQCLAEHCTVLITSTNTQTRNDTESLNMSTKNYLHIIMKSIYKVLIMKTAWFKQLVHKPLLSCFC